MEYRGHVVVVPYPSQGHINPLLQFAKRLASKGVKATLATTRYTVNFIRAPNIGVEPISDGFDEGGFAQAGKEDVYLNAFKANGSRTLSQLIHKHQHTTHPINSAFFTNSATVCAIFCRIHHGLLTLPVKLEDTPLLLPGLPPLNFPDLPTFVKFPESYPAYLTMKLSQYSNLDNVDWVIGNSFEELEGEAAKSISELWPGMLVGPMVPSAYLDGRIDGDKGYGASLWKPLSDKCIKWLEKKAPQSVASGQHFLWVVKESERSKLPEGFIDSAEEQGLIVTWCNQLEMLAHEAIGCFVSHCGWNSTLEGLSLGVPMVGVPQWTDQHTDAKFVEEIWEVGVRAKEDELGIVRRGELLMCLKEVMVGKRSEEIKRNAGKWRRLAKEAISEGGSSDQCINQFVEQLIQEYPYLNPCKQCLQKDMGLSLSILNSLVNVSSAPYKGTQYAREYIF
ncbi:unnamed protein product, partial [Vitis vinifera]